MASTIPKEEEIGEQSALVAVNTSGNEKLNASAMRIVNSAKKRALLNTSASARRQQTLKANNTALARSLSLAKEEVKLLRNKVVALKLENQDLKVKIMSAHQNTLVDEWIREQVKTKILDIMMEVEDEYGETRAPFQLAADRLKRLNEEFQEVSELFGQCKMPMQRLGDLIKKRIDEAGEWADEGSPKEEATGGARKTLAVRRKTHAEPGEDAAAKRKTIAVPRRKTQAPSIAIEEAQDDEKTAAPPPAIRRKTTAHTEVPMKTEQPDDTVTKRKTIASSRRETQGMPAAFAPPPPPPPVEPKDGIREDATEPPIRRKTMAVTVLEKMDEIEVAPEEPEEEPQDQTKKKSMKKKTPKTRSTKHAVQFSPEIEDQGSMTKEGQEENRRPRRHTATVSYKEPPLNNKLRRV